MECRSPASRSLMPGPLQAGHDPASAGVFASEADQHRLQAQLRQHLLPDWLQIPLAGAAGQEQHPSAQPQPPQLSPQLMGGAWALHVAPGLANTVSGRW